MPLQTKLYFFHQPGCPGCEMAMPAVKAFEKDNPHVEVIYWDLTEQKWDLDMKEPAGTPAFMAEDSRGVRTITGWVLDKEMLDLWIRRLPINPKISS